MPVTASEAGDGTKGFLRRILGELSDSFASPDWCRSRPLCLAVVAVAFLAVNGRSLSWGWLALDDWKFIVTNPNLGHGWHSVSWALTDVQFGRRWTPVLWLVACTCGVPTAFKFHVLVFVLGLVLCLLVTEVYGRGLPRGWALPAALLFTLSPLRNEVFTWSMGFVYETVAILLCMAWLLRRKVGWSGFFVVLALATYPQAAGAALAYCWAHRKHPAGWTVGGFLLLLVAIQYRLRVEYGIVPWHYRFDYLPIILPHYALNLFVPFATVPLFPSLFYPLLYVGGALIIVAAIFRPYPVSCWILLFAPTLIASVTEAFWFGTRYCLIPSIAAYAWLVFEASKLKSRVVFLLLWVVALAFGILNLHDVGMSRGVGLCARVASQEAALVGIDFDLVRTMRDQTPGVTAPNANAAAH
jgi:hypothetical protein